MKKKALITICTLITAIASIMPATSAYASSLSIKTSKSSVSVSDEVSVTIGLDGGCTAKSGGVEITFDGSLAYVTGSAAFKVSGTSLVNYDENRHKGAFAFDNAKEVSGDIITLKFKARYDGTPKIGAKLTLRDGNNVVLEESSSVKVTVGSGTEPTGATTPTTTGSETRPSGDGDETITLDDDILIMPEDETTKYDDASNSIFKRADGSTNVTLIIIIIAVILIAIIVTIVVIYNKREKGDGKGERKE